MWGVLELTAPRREDRHAADVSPEMLGIASDIEKALRHGAKEQAIEWARIVQDERAEVLGQGKNGVLIGRVEHFALSLGKPCGPGDALAFWAVPVATGIISASLMAAVVTAGFVSAQGGGVAQLVAYLGPADKYFGPLPTRLRSVNQPVIRSKWVFSSSSHPVGLHLSAPRSLTATIIKRCPFLDRLWLGPRRHPKHQHLSQRPNLIGESCRHCWCPWLPHLG